MAKFIYYDIALLIAFILVVGIFLYTHKKKLKIESKVFLLYRTKIGLKFIDWASKKFAKPLHVLGYVSIAFGFFGMLLAFLMLYFSISLMISMISIPKVPPLMPLLPYVPQIFNLPLPPFYFSYWLIIIVIIAVSHEFSHGIFARLYNLRVKSTGFGFLGPLLAAFVEPDEKAMEKKKAHQQLAILSAGSFANFIFAIIFVLLLQVLFLGLYQPAGITNYMYAYGQLNTSAIEKIGPYTLDEFFNLSDKEIANLTDLEVKTSNEIYYYKQELLPQIMQAKKTQVIILYQDAPAIRANLSGAIQRIESFDIKKVEDISKAMSAFKPGDSINIETSKGNYTLVLSQNPKNNSLAYLGIGFPELKGFKAFMTKLSSPFFSPFTYASPKANADFIEFILNLFFWLIIISISVSLLNMLPLGILDGGKFMYITALSLTKSKKKAEIIYKIFSLIVIAIFVALMLIWLIKM